MKNLVKTTIQISDLQIGMTVDHNGSLHTISNSNIKSSYWNLGQIGRPKTSITRVQFAVPTSNGIVLR